MSTHTQKNGKNVRGDITEVGSKALMLKTPVRSVLPVSIIFPRLRINNSELLQVLLNHG